MHQTSSILIIDQDPAIVDVLMDILTDACYISYSTSKDADTLRVIAQHPPGLILLDRGYPGRHSAALIETVRAASLARVPIVMLTTTARDIAPLFALGAVECLTKPFNLDELLACVARYVQPRATATASRALGA